MQKYQQIFIFRLNKTEKVVYKTKENNLKILIYRYLFNKCKETIKLYSGLCKKVGKICINLRILDLKNGVVLILLKCLSH